MGRKYVPANMTAKASNQQRLTETLYNRGVYRIIIITQGSHLNFTQSNKPPTSLQGDTFIRAICFHFI